MKKLKRILAIVICILIISLTILNCNKNTIYTSHRVVQGEPIKVSVLLYRFDDAYISLVKQSLEEIQTQNTGTVEFTFYDGKNDQGIYAINFYITTKIIVEYKFMSVIYE